MRFSTVAEVVSVWLTDRHSADAKVGGVEKSDDFGKGAAERTNQRLKKLLHPSRPVIHCAKYIESIEHANWQIEPSGNIVSLSVLVD